MQPEQSHEPEVEIVRLDPDLPLPSYAHPGDAGADLVSAVDVTLPPGKRLLVPTGIAIALPDGYAAFVHPRSGLAASHGLSIVNTPGTIDSGYRGEIKVLLINHDRHHAVVLQRGDRIAQLVIQPVSRATFVEAEALSDTARGAGGYGSTGGFAFPTDVDGLEGPKHRKESQVRFRRKATDEEVAAESSVAEHPDREFVTEGPFDIDDMPTDDQPRIDLGSLVVAPGEGRDLRVQVDQKSGDLRGVLLTGEDGALELRAYAAPRNGDLWSEIRPQIAADAARKGGTATEREGQFGTELVCEVKVATKDGRQGTQTSRVIGINGPRWLLRATLLGTPAREPDGAADWEEQITAVGVRRGDQAMPVGEPLPLNLPPEAQPADAEPPADAEQPAES